MTQKDFTFLNQILAFFVFEARLGDFLCTARKPGNLLEHGGPGEANARGGYPGGGGLSKNNLDSTTML